MLPLISSYLVVATKKDPNLTKLLRILETGKNLLKYNCANVNINKFIVQNT